MLDSPLAEHAIGHAVSGPLEVAQSPTVTEAIAQQGLGFADEVADHVNQRTRRADAITERVARRLLHRHARVEPPPPAVDT